MIDEHHHYHRVQIATGNGRGACGCVQVRSVAVEGGGRVRRMDCAARALAQLLQGYRMPPTTRYVNCDYRLP